MNWYLKVLKNYAVFSGRARRTEYWMFVLIHVAVLIAASVLDNILGTTIDDIGFAGLFYVLYGLIALIPLLAVSVRRLHDVGKSGWFLLVGLIPIIGSIWLLVLACKEGEPGPNVYGPNPKESAPAIS
jgi:uncharacterized membrane protein YhaH (DUF805 family)